MFLIVILIIVVVITIILFDRIYYLSTDFSMLNLLDVKFHNISTFVIVTFNPYVIHSF